MGCDIHAYIEYREKPTKENVGYNPWRPFGSRTNLGRNYQMFGRMAGVRREGIAVVQPRGYPDDMGYEAEHDATLYVDDKSSEESGFCSTARAEGWVKSGSSERWKGTTTRISNPDWHTPSWLTGDEFKKAIEEYQSGGEKDVSYLAALAAMKMFEAEGYESRIVFWFDN